MGDASEGRGLIHGHLLVVVVLSAASALGMEDGSITDGQITASSFWEDDNRWKASEGRLNNPKYFWSKGSGDSTPWIQVAFTFEVAITAIQTQGANDDGPGGDGEVWVEELKIQTGNSEDNLSYIWNGSTKVSLQTVECKIMSFVQMTGGAIKYHEKKLYQWVY